MKENKKRNKKNYALTLFELMKNKQPNINVFCCTLVQAK